mmetsp:Transcript_2814/g.4328  ORF Transcript_2814/g.4328 Transcript_2814/m.4328 type:complete len:709 (+) Transcript_2814:171-2297(+)
MNTVWVGSLPEGIAEAAVQNVFAERCGPVTTCSLKTKGTDTFAFIKFADPLGFEKALKMDQDSDAFGETIKVNFVKSGFTPGSTDDGNAGKSGSGGSKGGKGKGGGGWSKGGGKWWDNNGGWEGSSWWESNRNGQKGKGKNEGQTEDPFKVWVGGLPKEVTQSEIRSSFDKFGEIEEVKLVQKEHDTFAFITFKESRHVEHVIRKMNGSDEFGDPIKVNRVFVKHRPGGKGGDDRGGRGRDDRPSGGLRLRSRSARGGNREKDRGESRTRERRARARGGVVGSDFVRRALGNSGAVERRADRDAKRDCDDDDVAERSEDGDRRSPPRDARESPRGARDSGGYGYGDGDEDEESPDEEEDDDEDEEDECSVDKKDRVPEPRSRRTVEAKPRKVSATTKKESKAEPRKAKASSRKDPRAAAARAAAAAIRKGGKDAEAPESEGEEDDDDEEEAPASEGRGEESDDASEAAASDGDVRDRRAAAPRRSSRPVDQAKSRDREERRQSARDDDDDRRKRKNEMEAPSRGASRDRKYPEERKRRDDSRNRGTASRNAASGRDRNRDDRRDDGRDREDRDRRASRGGRDDDRDRERDRERDRDRGRGDDRGRDDRGTRSAKDHGGRSRSAARRRPQQMVRVDNLPDDMTLDELRQTAEDFGQVIAVKISKHLTNGCRTGMIEFQSGTDPRVAVSKLDKRRVEGWEKRLAAYLVDA